MKILNNEILEKFHLLWLTYEGTERKWEGERGTGSDITNQ